MIWLDFFLQHFVQGLGWAAAALVFVAVFRVIPPRRGGRS